MFSRTSPIGQLKLVQQFALDEQHLPLAASRVGIVAQAVIGNRLDGRHDFHRRAFGGFELQMNDFRHG